MWVPVAVWQPCELLYTCYLLTYFVSYSKTVRDIALRSRTWFLALSVVILLFQLRYHDCVNWKSICYRDWCRWCLSVGQKIVVWLTADSGTNVTWVRIKLIVETMLCCLYRCLIEIIDFRMWHTAFYRAMYASAVYAMPLCPPVCLSVCVCLSEVGVLLKRLNIMITQTRTHESPRLSFSDAKDLSEILSGSPPVGAPNASRVG